MEAYDELSQSGEIGVRTYHLLCERVQREVHRRGYPSSHPGRSWNDDDYAEVVHSLLVKKPNLTLSLLAAADQSALTALVTKIVRNFLIDQVKTSEIGKLSGRLETLMDADPRFYRNASGDRVLSGGPSAPTLVGYSELESAAWTPRGLTLGDLPSSGPTPAAARSALLSVAEAVLSAARGAVDRMTLARAVGRRFALLDPTTVGLPDPSVPTDERQPFTEPSRSILVILEEEERIAVTAAAAHDTTTAVAQALGCGRRRAQAILQRAIAKLQAVVKTEDLDVEQFLSTLDMMAPVIAQTDSDRSSSTDVNPMDAAGPDRTR